MHKTNFEHFLTLSPHKMASAILHIGKDQCVYCPRERLHRCNERCAGGLQEWLLSPYRKDAPVWKE